MRLHILTPLVLAMCFLTSTAYADVVCQDVKGSLSTRARCKRGEKKFSIQSLASSIPVILEAAGPIGPEGVQGVTGGQGPLGNAGASGSMGTAGGKGSKGLIDFSGCRKVVANDTSNILNIGNGSVTNSIFCNSSSEFLFHDEYTTVPFAGSAGTQVFVQSRSTDETNIGGDTKVTGVFVTYERFLTVGQGIYIVKLEGLCCPR